MRKLTLPRAPRIPAVLAAPRVPGLGATASKIVAVLVLVAVVAGGYAFWPQQATTKVSVQFARAVGLYPGSDVRVLGVKVGAVLAVRPAGDHVDVDIEYDHAVKVPVDAKAAVVAPSLVSDRYVQLLPVYTAGPAMPSGAKIPLDRTAVPVELDRISKSLDDLMVALGPQGANKGGSLSRLLDTSSANLKDQGQTIHDTAHDVSIALSALSGSKDDFFGTVRNLQSFTSMLATNNEQVKRLNTDLATVAQQLEGERGDLGAALQNLSVALNEISTFVKDNRTVLKTDVDQLTAVTGTLVKNRDALAEVLENAPVALSNLQNAYHPETGTLDTRDNLRQLQDIQLLTCGLLSKAGASAACQQLFDTLKKIPVVGQVLGVLAPGSAVPSALSATVTPPVPSGQPVAPGATNVHINGADPTLGGLLPKEAK